MIPILYEKTETTFTSNGLGRLTDCVRCIVTEERNGMYECEFDYPITGQHYSDITEGRIIAVTHDNNGDIQPFDIYHRTAPLNGIVTFYAHHISYRLNGIVVSPFTASGVANAIAGLGTNSIGTNPFSFSTDKTTAGTYTVSVPSTLKTLLAGEENSLLDVFGTGEYKFDKFSVSLLAARGTDTSVQIRYGKNLSELEHDVDYSNTYNGVVPFWYSTDPTSEAEDPPMILVTASTVYASGTTYDGRNTVCPLDLTQDFTEAVPTASDLTTLATSKLNASNTLLPNENITVSFIQLWQTKEYASVAPLEAVKLCDTVTVIYPELGISGVRSKVIKVVYNTLLDRYDEMELGDSLASYAALITTDTKSAIADLEDGLVMVKGAAQQAIYDADTAHTAAITAQGAADDAMTAAGVAQTAAETAEGHAQTALTNAGIAQAAAESAQADAREANIYANAALDQLGIVQDVVGVLEWASDHGTFTLTQDQTIQDGKVYFTYDSGTGDFVPVVNPQQSQLSTYYELSMDEAMQSFIMAHLAVTSRGLWVLPSGMATGTTPATGESQADSDARQGSDYKVLLANDGMYVYNGYGVMVGKYGSTAQIGVTGSTRFVIDAGELQAYDSSGNKYFEVSASGLTFGSSTAATTTDINNIQVGGRNLLRNSRDYYNYTLTASSGESAPTVSDGDPTDILTYPVIVSSTSKQQAAYPNERIPYSEIRNKTLTFSACYKAESGAVFGYLPLVDLYSARTGGTRVASSDFGFASTGTGNWEKVSHVVTITDDWFVDKGITSDYSNTYVKFGLYRSYDPTAYPFKGVVQLKEAKWEIGNKATDWSPAPEDLETYTDKAISDLSTTVGSTYATKATAVASTVSVYYRSTTQSAPSISTSTSIGTATNTDNAWEYTMPVPKRGCYFYTCEKYTMVNGDVSFSTVRELSSETYASKWVSSSDSTYIDGGRIYANSVTAEQIAANAITIGKINQSDSSTASAILNSNIEVGGRNLLLNSANYDPSKAPYSNSNVSAYSGTFGTYQYYYCSGTYYAQVDFPTLESGVEYAISFDIARSSVTPIYVTVGGTTVNIGDTLASAWKRASYVFTASSSTTYARIQVNTASSTGSNGWIAAFKSFKLERGNKATDWTPAPEDVDSGISDASKTATSYITSIDSNNGIQVHAQNNPTTNYAQINASGMEVYKGGTSVAFYGDESRVGKTSSGHITTLSDGILLYDSHGSSPFNVSLGSTSSTGKIHRSVTVANGATVTTKLPINTSQISTLTAYTYIDDATSYVSMTIPTTVGTSTTKTEYGCTYTLTLVASGRYTLTIANNSGSSLSFIIEYTTTYYPAEVLVNDAFLQPQTFDVLYNSADSLGFTESLTIYTWGKIAMMKWVFSSSGSIAVGKNIMSSYLFDVEWLFPIDTASLTGYYGATTSRALTGQIDSNGNMTVINASTTSITVDSGFVTGTWIMK